MTYYIECTVCLFVQIYLNLMFFDRMKCSLMQWMKYIGISVFKYILLYSCEKVSIYTLFFQFPKLSINTDIKIIQINAHVWQSIPWERLGRFLFHCVPNAQDKVCCFLTPHAKERCYKFSVCNCVSVYLSVAS